MEVFCKGCNRWLERNEENFERMVYEKSAPQWKKRCRRCNETHVPRTNYKDCPKLEVTFTDKELQSARKYLELKQQRLLIRRET